MVARVAVSVLSLLVAACNGRPVTPVPGEYRILIGTPPVLLLTHVEPVPQGNAARRVRLTELFSEAGCDRLEDRSGASELPHVVCTLPGSGDGTIVVSANFDQPIRSGFPDNWSGAAMLPSLYLSLQVAERQHTYEFVAFSGESRTRPGSPAASFRMVDGLSEEERASIAALVSLQGLQIDVPAVWKVHADPDLHLDLRSVSRSLELPMGHIDLVWRHRTRRGRLRVRSVDVPSILIGLADVHAGEYLDSFRLVATYLGYLDQTIEVRRRMREAPKAEEPPASG